MKREDINTIIAMSGLILAAYSTYKQSKPEADKLELTADIGFVENAEVKLNKDIFVPKALYGNNTRLAGPASILLEVSNNMSRPVTIKKIKIELIKDNRAVVYSNMLDPLDGKTLENLSSPTTIAEHSVKKIDLQINVPIHYNDKISYCFRSIKTTKLKAESIGNVRLCYYKNGIDLFGNKVQFTQFEGGEYLVESLKEKNLSYRVTVMTGDNSKMLTLATF